MKKKYWIEAQNITAFKNGNKVINNLSLKFQEKERIIILGPNGSGKSSIVDLINRNIYPIIKSNSYLKIFNKKLINIWEIRKYISTVSNEIKFRINPELKVVDLLISGLYGNYVKKDNSISQDFKKVNELIEKMDLGNIAKKPFGYLSDGEKQISLIGRAIINNPKVLILDEPSVNIDLKSKIFLTKKIDNLSKLGISILCITHDVSLITKDYNRIILLKNGTIYKEGNTNQLMNTKNINKLFDIKVKVVENNNSWDIIRN